MQILDICLAIDKDLSGDALENQLGSLHNAMFGSSDAFDFESLQAHIDTAVEELKLNTKGKFSRKSLESPTFIAETCLLLGILLISSCQRSSFEPTVENYFFHLENFLLPRVFSRTKILPIHLRNILLKNPLNCFASFSESQLKKDYWKHLQDFLKDLHVNFGVDLLFHRDGKKKAEFFEKENISTGIEVVKTKQSTEQGLLHRPRKKEIQLCTPKYLLTKKRKIMIKEKEVSPPVKSGSGDFDYHTPENSDDEVLVAETPEKRRRI